MASKWPWMMYRTPGYSGIEFDLHKRQLRMQKIKKIYGITNVHKCSR